MVIPIRELVNIVFPFTLNFQSNQTESYTTQLIDIEIDTLRDQSTSFSPNSFRKMLVHSNTSSIVYVDKIQALANNLG